MQEPKSMLVKPLRFINSEPGLVSFGHGPVPVVVLSFGAEEGPIEDVAVNIIEARQMVMDILISLAHMGDPLAQAIGNQYFGASTNEGEPESEFDTGSDYDGNDGDCTECG